MKGLDSLNTALKAGVKLYLKDGQLAYKTTNGPLEESLKKTIVANKADIIALLKLYQQDQPTVNRPAIVPQTNHEETVLSFAQQRLWFIEQYFGQFEETLDDGDYDVQSSNFIDEESTKNTASESDVTDYLYNVTHPLKLTGDIDHTRVKIAFENLINRHQILRTVYHSKQGNPYQEVLNPDVAAQRFNFNVSDAQSEKRQPEFVDSLVKSVSRQRFNLAMDLPIRINLTRVSNQEFEHSTRFL